MYRAVLFDFGGVFTQSPFETVRLAGDDVGADPELVLAVLFGDYDQNNDHPWHRLERGEIAFDDARTEINALADERGLDFDPFRAFARFVIDSSHVGVRKPDPAIFQLALDALLVRGGTA